MKGWDGDSPSEEVREKGTHRKVRALPAFRPELLSFSPSLQATITTPGLRQSMTLTLRLVF